MSATEIMTQLGIGGILVLLVIREFLTFLARRRQYAAPNGKGRRDTDKFNDIKSGVNAILQRLDRIVERLEDVADSTRYARKQSEITRETTERMARAVSQLEKTLNEAGRRRTTDTSPGL